MELPPGSYSVIAYTNSLTAPSQVVTVRAAVSGPGIQARPPRIPDAEGPPESSPGRSVVAGRAVDAPRFWREALRVGHRVDGPAVIQDYSATTWVPPEWHATAPQRSP